MIKRSAANEGSCPSACYVCGEPKTCEWHSLWYDGQMRRICSLSCRSTIEDWCDANPEKTYSHFVRHNSALGRNDQTNKGGTA